MTEMTKPEILRATAEYLRTQKLPYISATRLREEADRLDAEAQTDERILAAAKLAWKVAPDTIEIWDDASRESWRDVARAQRDFWQAHFAQPAPKQWTDEEYERIGDTVVAKVYRDQGHGNCRDLGRFIVGLVAGMTATKPGSSSPGLQ